MLKFLKAHKLLVLVIVITAVALVVGALYKYKLVQAEITNNALIEQNKVLSKSYAEDRAEYIKNDKAKILFILNLKESAAKKELASQAIQVKNANEIKALRFMAGTWEEKYNRLESECLQLSAKVGAQDETIGILKLTIGEMEGQLELKDRYIAGLEVKFVKCQKLLDISIANTDSILKKPWFLKIFNKVKIGPAVMVSTDGVFRLGLAAVWAIN